MKGVLNEICWESLDLIFGLTQIQLWGGGYCASSPLPLLPGTLPDISQKSLSLQMKLSDIVNENFFPTILHHLQPLTNLDTTFLP